MKCSICKEVIVADKYGWDGGCNAQPVNDGTCCSKCDEEIVIPRRLKDAGIDINSVQTFIPKFPTHIIREEK